MVSSEEPAGRPATDAQPAANGIAALPLGGHIKFDPWDDQLTFLKAKPVSSLAEDEKKPFQITPFAFYLTRQGVPTPAEAAGATATNLDLQAKP